MHVCDIVSVSVCICVCVYLKCQSLHIVCDAGSQLSSSTVPTNTHLTVRVASYVSNIKKQLHKRKKKISSRYTLARETVRWFTNPFLVEIPVNQR